MNVYCISLYFYDFREAPEEFKYEDDEDSNDEDFRGNEYPDVGLLLFTHNSYIFFCTRKISQICFPFHSYIVSNIELLYGLARQNARFKEL